MDQLKIEELLFNDQPITVNRKLAKCLGLNESVIFQQIHYWLKINERTKNNFKEGRYWVYNSIKEWKENEFDFLSESTVKRTLQKLTKLGLLDVGNFNKMKGDKTNWYTINYDNLLIACEKVLNKKIEVSEKRKVANKKGLKVKKQNIKGLKVSDTNISDHGLNLNLCPSAQVEPMIGSICTDDKLNLNQAIPEITTKISTEITISSSKGDCDWISLFQDCIGELKKTTRGKFLKYCNECNQDLVESILEYAATINIRSYAGFEKIINSALDKNITTGEEFKKSVKEYRNKKKSETITKASNKAKPLRFNNFEARTYDYDDLEKGLLNQKGENVLSDEESTNRINEMLSSI